MKTIVTGWNFMRALRLVLGTAILIQGLIYKDTFAIVLGAAFSGMALANIGCCGVSGCAVSPPPANGKVEDVEYEEVYRTK